MSVRKVLQIRDLRDFAESSTGQEWNGLDSTLSWLRREHPEIRLSLPGWAIDEEEILYDDKIGDSGVWHGRFENRQVVITRYPPDTQRDFFTTQMVRWRELEHEYILPMFGASSTFGPPPWEVVNPNMVNGNIKDYLYGQAGSKTNKSTLLCQVAKAMRHLHVHEYPHGDLKVSRVLVDENGQAKLSLCAKPLFREIHQLDRTFWTPKHAAADVVSFGWLVFEVYGGSPTFNVDPSNSVYALTSDDRPATMPPEIWKICDRCCRATPTTSFEEIEASLCTFENQEPVTDEKEWKTWVRERQLALPREFQTATLEEEEHLVTSGSFAPLASGIGPSTSIFQTDSKSEKGDASPPPASRTEMVLNLCSVQLNRLRVISEEKEEKVYWLLDLEEAARLIREMLESARKWRVKQDSAILLVERSAFTLTACEQAIIDKIGQPLADSRESIPVLIRHLIEWAAFMREVSQRSLFQQYLYQYDTQGRLDMAMGHLDHSF